MKGNPLVSRRWFIGGMAAAGAAFSGCRFMRAGGIVSAKPKLRLGIVSDIHIMTVGKPGEDPLRGNNNLTFRKTLEWFDAQGVDGVIVAGDMADRGMVEQLEAVAEAWYAVFPEDKGKDGRHVEKLFVYGNHDWEGYRYGDFAERLYADPEERVKHILRCDCKGHWERIFHEPYSPVWMKTVKGFAVVGAHWCADYCRGWEETGVAGVEEFFSENRSKIDPSLPFFYIQHPHPKDTCYGHWAWGHDNGGATRALTPFPNAIAFSGHSHYSLNDERSIWQGAFTSIGTSSLRYTGAPAIAFPGLGYENSTTSNKGTKLTKDQIRLVADRKVMPAVGTGLGRQGMLLSVYDDCVRIARREFVFDESLGEDWVMPLPASESKPFAFAVRKQKAVAPQFAAGAKIAMKRGPLKNRAHKRVDAFTLTFPAAGDATLRPFEYEVNVERDDGSVALTRYVLASDFHLPPSKRHLKQSFAISCDQLPQNGPFRFVVKPRESFGRTGNGLATEFTRI
ncbi:MAG: metallophosphoesterase [Kiritimatiellae bacterium]|nr:metallophosphoesterase [Kiritimatiellia bacterium]